MNMKMSLLHFVFLIVASGALGGLVSAIIFKDQHHIWAVYNHKHHERNLYHWAKILCMDFGFFLGRIIMGIGGAFGIIFIGFWSKSLSNSVCVENQILLMGLCVVAGTFSHRILPRLADQIEARIGAAENKMKLIEGKATELEQKTEEGVSTVADLISAITFGRSALHEGFNPDRKEAISRLEKLRIDFPKDRSLNLMIGRLYRRENKYDDAIISLSNYAKLLAPDVQKSSKPEGVVVDCADAYYNMACYHALKAVDNQGSEKQRLQKEAIEILKMSVSLLPANKECAAADPDFDSLKGNEEFEAIIKG